MCFKSIIQTITLLALFFSFLFPQSAASLPVKIGVIQVIEHPALDETRQGIYDEVAQQFRGDLNWTWESAQGNSALAAQIAQKYMGQNVNVVIAIGTTAAQAALNATRHSEIPVIFASVTDPASAKLTGNITGVSNFVNPEKQFAVIQKILGAKKRIGIIYNPGEANSHALLTGMKAASCAINLEIIAAPAVRTSDVTSCAAGLASKVDAIFINNDNTALAAISGVGNICRENKIPLFASDGDLKACQALAIMGADQYEVGRQAGRIAAEILRGQKQASDIEPVYPDKLKFQINHRLARELNISVPADLSCGEAE